MIVVCIYFAHRFQLKHGLHSWADCEDQGKVLFSLSLSLSFSLSLCLSKVDYDLIGGVDLLEVKYLLSRVK